MNVHTRHFCEMMMMSFLYYTETPNVRFSYASSLRIKSEVVVSFYSNILSILTPALPLARQPLHSDECYEGKFLYLENIG
jgi:hypothetical protein